MEIEISAGHQSRKTSSIQNLFHEVIVCSGVIFQNILECL